MEKSNIDEKIKLLTGSGMWHTQEVEGLPSVHCRLWFIPVHSTRAFNIRWGLSI